MKDTTIKIEYDGEYPNLCSGHLFVIIDGKRWDFGADCLSSGGSVTFDADWNECVSCGVWSIHKYPENFPEELKQLTLNYINDTIPLGCCGGCV